MQSSKTVQEHQLFNSKTNIGILVSKLKEETQSRWYFYPTKASDSQEEVQLKAWLRVEGRAAANWRFQRVMATWGNGVQTLNFCIRDFTQRLTQSLTHTGRTQAAAQEANRGGTAPQNNEVVQTRPPTCAFYRGIRVGWLLSMSVRILVE